MSRTTFSILLILIGIAVYYFFFVDQWAALQDIRKDAIAADQALSQLKDISAKADNLRETYNSVLQENKDKVTKMIPTGPNTADLVVDLEQMAQRNGLILRSVDFSIPDTSAKQQQEPVRPGVEANFRTGVFILPVSFLLDGRYDAFRRFQADLELNQRVLDMTTINFGSALNDSYAFQLGAKAYYQ